MYNHGARRRGAVFACGAAAFVSVRATADRLHTLQPHETISGLAAQFHVTVAEIVRANHLKNPDCVPDFTKLRIPDAGHRFIVSQRMHRDAHIARDAVNVRVGPGKDRPVFTSCDKGQKIAVTAIREDWAQVELPSGRSGWILRDLVAYGSVSGGAGTDRATEPQAPARATPKKVAKTERPHKRVQIARADGDDKPHRKRIAHRVEHAAQARHSSRKLELAHVNTGADVVRTAYAYRGTPYRYGGSSRNGFDCSGFTRYVFARKGISLPHSARAQFHEGKSIERTSMKPGDLVFFHTVTAGISHVGVYVGSGKFVHASSRREGGVRVDSLSDGYYRNAFRGARRVK